MNKRIIRPPQKSLGQSHLTRSDFKAVSDANAPPIDFTQNTFLNDIPGYKEAKKPQSEPIVQPESWHDDLEL